MTYGDANWTRCFVKLSWKRNQLPNAELQVFHDPWADEKEGGTEVMQKELDTFQMQTDIETQKAAAKEVILALLFPK